MQRQSAIRKELEKQQRIERELEEAACRCQQRILDDIYAAAGKGAKEGAKEGAKGGQGAKGGRGGRGGAIGCGGGNRVEATATSVSSSDQDNTCVICFVGARTHTAVPCGHLSFCGDCVSKMNSRKTCPECNTELDAAKPFMRLYM